MPAVQSLCVGSRTWSVVLSVCGRRGSWSWLEVGRKMPKRDRRTTMGGMGDAFQSTHWSQIRQARTSNEERRRICVNNLLERYWKPVYCYLRRKGYDNEQAKDLTQDFFCEIALGRELFQRADESKGRFRTFLLTALDRHVTSVHRKETARKRAPRDGLAPLEAADIPEAAITQSGNSPEQVFYRAWVANLLEQVLTQVQEHYCSTGKETHWRVFHTRIMAPMLENSDPPSLTDLCRDYQIATEKKASNMIATVKRRFEAVLKSQLRQHVQSDAEVEEELRELIKILSEGGAA